MTEHTISWYESEDGEIFANEDECMNHEAKILYDQSGVRFYGPNWEKLDFKVEDDQTYNECYYMVIDRTNEKNKRFIDYMNYIFGWCLLKEAYDMDGDNFVLEMSKAIPVSSHLVY